MYVGEGSTSTPLVPRSTEVAVDSSSLASTSSFDILVGIGFNTYKTRKGKKFENIKFEICFGYEFQSDKIRNHLELIFKLTRFEEFLGRWLKLVFFIEFESLLLKSSLRLVSSNIYE